MFFAFLTNWSSQRERKSLESDDLGANIHNAIQALNIVYSTWTILVHSTALHSLLEPISVC